MGDVDGKALMKQIVAALERDDGLYFEAEELRHVAEQMRALGIEVSKHRMMLAAVGAAHREAGVDVALGDDGAYHLQPVQTDDGEHKAPLH